MAGAEVVATKVIEIDVRQSQEALEHLRAIARAGKTAESSLQQMGSTIQKGFSGLASAGNRILGFLGIFGVTDSMYRLAQWTIDAVDKFTNLENRIKQFTSSQMEATQSFDSIMRIANTSGRAIEDVGKLYEKVAIAGQKFGLSQKDISKISEGFSQSLRLSGANTQEASAAILQFGQALQSGKFQGDEFRSMMENNAVFMRALADQLGVSTSKLREMSTEGELTANKMMKALTDKGQDGLTMMDRLIEKADKLPLTFKQAAQGIANEFGAIATSLVDLFTPVRAEGEKGYMEGIIQQLEEDRDKLAKLNAEYDAMKLTGFERVWDFFKRAYVGGIASLFTGNKEVITSAQQASEKISVLSDELAKTEEKLKNLESRKFLTWYNKQAINDAKRDIKGLREEIEKLSAVENQRIAESDEVSRLASRYPKPITPPPEEKKKEKGSKKVSELEQEAKAIHKAMIDAESEGNKVQEMQVRLAEAYMKSNKTVKDQAMYLTAVGEALKIADLERHKKELEASAKAVEEYNKAVEKTPWAQKLKEFERIRDHAKAVPELMDNLQNLLMSVPPEQIPIVEKLINDLQNIRTETKKTNESVNILAYSFAQNLSKSIEGLSEDIVDFAFGAEKSFGDMVESMLKNMLKLQIQMQVTAAIAEAMGTKEKAGWLVKFFSSMSMFGGTGTTAPAAFEALGGVYTNGQRVNAYANGTIVNRPTLFPMAGGAGLMGEAGPEAVMPLTRTSDGKLGVQTTGGSGMTVNVYNQTGDKVKAEESKDAYGNDRLDIYVTQAVNRGLGAGQYDRVLSTTFGITRKGR